MAVFPLVWNDSWCGGYQPAADDSATHEPAIGPPRDECLELLQRLEEAGEMTRSQLLRVMRCNASDLDRILGTLIEQRKVVQDAVPTRTRPAVLYRLVE